MVFCKSNFTFYYSAKAWYVLLLSLSSFKVFAQEEITDSIIQSSSTIKNKHLINSQFHEVFLQNTKPGFFGREYGSPVKSILNSEVVTNFIIF